MRPNDQPAFDLGEEATGGITGAATIAADYAIGEISEKERRRIEFARLQEEVDLHQTMRL